MCCPKGVGITARLLALLSMPIHYIEEILACPDGLDVVNQHALLCLV